MKARRDFIKAFVASAGTLTFSGAAMGQAEKLVPAITLLLNEDPQFVLTAPGSGSVIVATPFLLGSASMVVNNVFLPRPLG